MCAYVEHVQVSVFIRHEAYVDPFSGVKNMIIVITDAPSPVLSPDLVNVMPVLARDDES